MAMGALMIEAAAALVAIIKTMATSDHFDTSAAGNELTTITEGKFTAAELFQHNAGFSSCLYTAAKEFADGQIAKLIMSSEGDVDDSVLTSLHLSDFEDAILKL